MKSLIKLLIVSLILTTSAKHVLAQTDVIGKWYKTTVDLTVKSSDTAKSAISYRVRPGTKFTVINISGTNYEIVFGHYSDPKPVNTTKNLTQEEALSLVPGGERPPKNSEKRYFDVDTFSNKALNTYPTTLAFISKWANYKTFYLSATDLSSKCDVYYPANVDFTWGASTMPLKVRFGNGKDTYSSYEENLNLGLTCGVKLTLSSTKDQSINIVALAEVTAVTVDSVSLKSAAFYDPKNTSTKALTFGLGTVYQYANFQVGVFGGIDHISGQLGREWKNQDRPWLGIGIGLALFNNQAASTGSKASNSTSSE